MISLEEAKNYLRVDFDADDSLISALLSASKALCRAVARLSEDDWNSLCSDTSPQRDLMRVGILYTLGYMYEHREEADHHDLVITLRNLLHSIREGKL